MPRRVSKTEAPSLSPPKTDSLTRAAIVLNPAELGSVLRWMRGLQGNRQTDVAASLGVSPELLRGLEKGDRGVRLETAMEVCARLGLDLIVVPRDSNLSLQVTSDEAVQPAKTRRANPAVP